MLSSVELPVAPKVMVPLFVMLPSTVRTVLFRRVTESPVLLRVRVPMVGLSSSCVAAVVVLIRMFSPLVIAPLFQLLASLHLVSPLPPPPVQVSVVTNGRTPFGVGARVAATDAWGAASCESLCLEAEVDWPKAKLSTAKSAARMESTLIHRTTREVAGRMGNSAFFFLI